jgi:hypothetical protein
MQPEELGKLKKKNSLETVCNNNFSKVDRDQHFRGSCWLEMKAVSSKCCYVISTYLGITSCKIEFCVLSAMKPQTLQSISH